MKDNIAVQLDKAYYVRSKISYYPLSHSILPVPDGMSVIIFENQQDIDQYFQFHGITDPENFDILRVNSFYDFMREIADMGFIGCWYLNNFPIFFGNYVSEIDIELPSFAYTYDNQFIGASGKIDAPQKFIQWQNYLKTDKMIRRFVRFANGVPFSPTDTFFTIVYTDGKYFEKISGATERIIRYCRFPDASPLQGPYVSDLGAYCLFFSEEYAVRYLSSRGISDQSIYRVEKMNGVHSFLESISVLFPLVDIGINPGNQRYLQGYFLQDQERWFVKTVLGIYEVKENQLQEIEDDENISRKGDTIEKPNTADPSLRRLRTSIKNPLKNVLGTTKSLLPWREAEEKIDKIIKMSKYVDSANGGYPIEIEDISTDSFLVFGFDKIIGIPFTNNEEMVGPYVFQDVLDAILYFYHVHFVEQYQLRLKGFVYCQSNTKLPGTRDEALENYFLHEQRTALQDLLKMIFTEGYKLEHSEFLKMFINRSSLSLEIEECGYLGDLAIFKESYLESSITDDDDSDIAKRIIRIVRKYQAKLGSKIQLDEKYQNRIRIYLGHPYENMSLKSLLILESALKQFDSIEQRINHDYAGITMKLCKVFERELNILVFQKWKHNILERTTKIDLENNMKEAEDNRDETTRKLVGWLQSRNKLELGPMTYAIKRLVENCDNVILRSLNEYVSSLNNRAFILSQDFLETCRLVSTRYRNGGVHEKIVTYEICKEAFENILINENNYLKNMVNI